MSYNVTKKLLIISKLHWKNNEKKADVGELAIRSVELLSCKPENFGLIFRLLVKKEVVVVGAFSSGNFQVDTGIKGLFTRETSLYRESQHSLKGSFQKRDGRLVPGA